MASAFDVLKKVHLGHRIKREQNKQEKTATSRDHRCGIPSQQPRATSLCSRLLFLLPCKQSRITHTSAVVHRSGRYTMLQNAAAPPTPYSATVHHPLVQPPSLRKLRPPSSLSVTRTTVRDFPP
ncbi:putative methyltransferase type 11 [Sesbania bispinosa]|nr:putative methyltransferase type 11 [Sesbania bispinosa]